MRIGILGSGLMGGKLGMLFARAGHEVIFSYAHSDRKLQRLAREAKGVARAGTVAEAARRPSRATRSSSHRTAPKSELLPPFAQDDRGRVRPSDSPRCA